MNFLEFWRTKDRICRIYNGSPGIIKEPHDECPLYKLMKREGMGDAASCHDFIAEHPEPCIVTAMEWEKTYKYPKNEDVFLKILNDKDCRYSISDDGRILFNGEEIGKLKNKWRKSSSKNM